MRQGNFMRKGRVTLSLSAVGQMILDKLADDEGCSVSDVIERLGRVEFDRIYGRENRPKPRTLVKNA